MKKNYVSITSDKSRKIALICAIVGGWIGAHHYYVGNILKGLLFTFTFGVFGIGWIFDIIMVLCGFFKDNAGAPLREW